MTASITRVVRLAATATLSTLAVVTGADASGYVPVSGQANTGGAGSVNAAANRSR